MASTTGPYRNNYLGRLCCVWHRLERGSGVPNGWDAHSVTKVASAFNMGDFNVLPTFFSLLIDPDLIDSPVFDQDIKGNSNLNFQGI